MNKKFVLVIVLSIFIFTMVGCSSQEDRVNRALSTNEFLFTGVEKTTVGSYKVYENTTVGMKVREGVDTSGKYNGSIAFHTNLDAEGNLSTIAEYLILFPAIYPKDLSSYIDEYNKQSYWAGEKDGYCVVESNDSNGWNIKVTYTDTCP
jgi:uncharacterized lipoprotein NlpE involved in copper resistance